MSKLQLLELSTALLRLILSYVACSSLSRLVYSFVSRRFRDFAPQFSSETREQARYYFCCLAAADGYLALLQWGRRNGCPYDPHACESAAKRGHLELLKWLRANGYSWGYCTCA